MGGANLDHRSVLVEFILPQRALGHLEVRLRARAVGEKDGLQKRPKIAKKRQKLIVPPFVNLVPIFRILPTNVFDKVADFLGINDAMDKFTGRH